MTDNLRRGLSIDDWQERHAWIVTDEGLVVPFLDNPAQVELRREIARVDGIARERHLPERTLIVKPRRAGYTRKLSTRLLVRAVTEPNKRFLYLNATDPDTRDAFRDVRWTFEHLAADVRPALANAQSEREMVFPDLGSRLQTKSASVTGGVRGRGYAEGLWDEVPRIAEVFPAIEEQRRFLQGAVLPAFRYGAFRLLFTPDGVDGIEFDLWQGSIRGENDWLRVFIPWTRCADTRIFNLTGTERVEIRETLTEEERDLCARLLPSAPTDEQVERIAWRRRKRREIGKLFPQEYPEDEVSCWIAPGTVFFSPDAIAWQRARARPPILRGSDLAGTDGRFASRMQDGRGEPRLIFYVPPHPDHSYIVATDYGVGHGTGDPSMSLVLDFDTAEVVAELYGHFEPLDFTRLSISLLCIPYGEALWAPELDGPGRAGIAHAREVLEYHNIYRHIRTHGTSVEYAHELGWRTDALTRPVMLEDLALAFEEKTVLVNSRRALADAQSFKLKSVTGKASRYEAEAGAHDEGVIVLAIANYIRLRANVRTAIF